MQANAEKIITAGWVSSNSDDFFIARFNVSNLALDTSFDGDGMLSTTFGTGSAEVAHGVAIQPDGRIVAVGETTPTGGTTDFAVSRCKVPGGLEQRQFTQTDADGSLTSITDANGQVAERYLYTPYGEVEYRGGSWETLQGDTTQFAWVVLWRGMRWNSGTGLYHTMGGEYSPKLGRVINCADAPIDGTVGAGLVGAIAGALLGETIGSRPMTPGAAQPTGGLGGILSIFPSDGQLAGEVDFSVDPTFVRMGGYAAALAMLRQARRRAAWHRTRDGGADAAFNAAWWDGQAEQWSEYIDRLDPRNYNPGSISSIVWDQGMSKVTPDTREKIEAGVEGAAAGSANYLAQAEKGANWVAKKVGGGENYFYYWQYRADRLYSKLPTVTQKARWQSTLAARASLASFAGAAALKTLSYFFPRLNPNIFGRHYCFPADTPVATEAGLRPISQVNAGERVWGYDFVAGTWRLAEVERRHENPYDGLIVTIELDGQKTVRATQNHPFWVVEGRDLDQREVPPGLANREDEGGALAGRWVKSHELREGDTIFLRTGGMATVRRVSQRYERMTVYNLTVPELHTYAVGETGVLVHNTSGPGPRGIQPREVDLLKLEPPPSRPYVDPAKLARHGPFDMKKYTPIIVEKTASGRLIIMDGMTRVTNALRAGIKKLPAYVFPRS